MLTAERDAIEFVTEAYRHCKPIAATGEGVALLRACPGVLGPESGSGDVAEGVIASSEPASPALIQTFLAAIAGHRFWDRARKNRMEGPVSDDTRGRVAVGSMDFYRIAVFFFAQVPYDPLRCRICTPMDDDRRAG